MAHEPTFTVLAADVRLVACGDCGAAVPDDQTWLAKHVRDHRRTSGGAGDASASRYVQAQVRTQFPGFVKCERCTGQRPAGQDCMCRSGAEDARSDGCVCACSYPEYPVCSCTVGCPAGPRHRGKL
jgi:hypothetical protein